MGEKGEEEEGAGLGAGEKGNMSGGKPVAVWSTQEASAIKSSEEDQRGESSSTEDTPWRRRYLCVRRASQWRMACSKVLGAERHLGQREGVSLLNQEGWAAR